MQWFDVLLRTSLQSLISTGLSLFCGFFVAVFLMADLSSMQRKYSNLFLLWPSLMPAYFWFIVTGFYGHQSVMLLIFVQVLMNMGWVAWRLQAYWSDQLSRSLELSFVEGASWSKTITQVLFPLSRAQLFHIAISVFLFCFSNYSLAMLLAGSSWSLDVFLMQQWQQGHGVSSTFTLAFGLWAFMLLIYWYAPLTINKPQAFVSRYPMLQVFLGRLFLACALLLPLTFIYLFFQHVAWSLFLHLVPWTAMFDSLLIGLVTGWILWFLGVGALLLAARSEFNFILSSLVSPPITLLGLVLSFLEFRGSSEIIVLGLGFALMLWPLLYRVFVSSSLASLSQQLQTAEVCGASRLHTLLHVILPQLSRNLFAMSALGAFWSVGDFSLATVLSYETKPLAKLIFEKLNRYEMDLAHAWFFWLLITAFIAALFFIGCSYVADRKPKSSV